MEKSYRIITERLDNERKKFEDSLILNPTENIPWVLSASVPEFAEGLYVPEDRRGKDSKVSFGGRNELQDIMVSSYKRWEELLGASASSFKLYSGLHAHIVLFMSLAYIGEIVVLIPENAGGHYASSAILKRLGLNVYEFPIDCDNYCIDKDASMDLIDRIKPNYIFFDRSDGLIYEDFSWIKQCHKSYAIFDASQYLTHILAGDYMSPFDMGADIILTSTHKNYPGPQKAAFFTKEINEPWERITKGVASFVSNTHPMDIFRTTLSLFDIEEVKKYSSDMIKNTLALEHALRENGIPVVKRPQRGMPTQQIWIPTKNEEFGYELFQKLETLGINVNYRTLPYNLGKGLRLGTAAATRQGLRPDHADDLAKLIACAWNEPISEYLITRTHKVITEIKQNAYCKTNG